MALHSRANMIGAAGAGMTCAGTQKVDDDRARWRYVPKGTCKTLKKAR